MKPPGFRGSLVLVVVVVLREESQLEHVGPEHDVDRLAGRGGGGYGLWRSVWGREADSDLNQPPFPDGVDSGLISTCRPFEYTCDVCYR